MSHTDCFFKIQNVKTKKFYAGGEGMFGIKWDDVGKEYTFDEAQSVIKTRRLEDIEVLGFRTLHMVTYQVKDHEILKT